MILDKWQKEVLGHKGDLILCCGRQIGKTTIFARKAAERMLAKPNQRIIIVSLSEDQAKLIIIMILTYLEKNHANKLMKGIKYVNRNLVTLKNKSYALARPVGQTGDAIRGFTGDVLIIDEASRFPEDAFTAGEPTLLSTGGEVWMCSTPFGKTGYFWEQYNAATSEDEEENEMGWKVIHVNGEIAIKERPISSSWTEQQRNKAIKRLESIKKRWSALRYAQEIQAEFLDDLMRFYSDKWIEHVCILKRQPLPNGNNYLGVDIARMGGDKTTYEGVHDYGTQIRQIEHHQEEYKPTTHTEERIISFSDRYNKIGIDAGAGSLGVGIFDHLLENMKTKRKVIAMNNRALSQDREGKSKLRLKNEDYHDNLRSMGEHGEILLLDDEDIKNSFRSIQMEIVKHEDLITSIRIYGNNSHIVEGIKRAAYLAKKEKSKSFNIHYI